MKFFIGSSREQLDLVGQVAYWLEQAGHEPLPWDKPGLFRPGEQTFMTLIQIAGEVDGALFLFSEDDKVWYRADAANQPRDNVLIEYGLFAGKLGPTKAVICRVGAPKNAVDLMGLTYVDLSQGKTQRARIEINFWVNSLASTPVDPALHRLTGQIYELKQEKEQLEKKIQFETEKTKDLERIISERTGLDLSQKDVSPEGHWKLLFNYYYFQRACNILSQSFALPANLKESLEETTPEVADMIAWHIPGLDNKERIDPSPDRKIYLARKVLRVFRQWADCNLYGRYLMSLPTQVQGELDGLAASAIAAEGRQ